MQGHRIVITVVIAFMALAPVFAADLLVPEDYRSIQEAIDAAADGDRILVAAGTHFGNGFRGISFLGKAVTVEGAGMDQTVIDCEQLDRGFDFQYGEGLDSTVRNLTIINGLDGCGT
ncbi:MAG TPA: hypothetical protein PLV45_12005 [bacterium]|nr:hypothetical protein [bacterium]